jgi:ComF family protein
MTLFAASRLPARLLSGLKAAGCLVMPQRCIGCGETIDGDGAFCAACWGNIRFLGSPLCDGCGFPFDFDVGSDALCGACIADRPAYGRARAVFAYNEHSRGPVLAFKHADRTDIAPAFARLMMTAGGELLTDATLIVPVPLHRLRLVSRRYNQAALLAHALGRRSNIAVAPDLLVRTRRTSSQGGLGPAARRRNVQGAFAIRSGMAEQVAGARILLVDDVLTTGATVEACTRVLMRAGASQVDVLTLARVVRAEVV